MGLSNVQPHNQFRYICVSCGHAEQKVITLNDEKRLKLCPECKFTAMLPSDAEPLEVLQTRLNFITITSDQIIRTLREVLDSKNEEIKVLHQDVGFYRSYALSGEVPEDGAEPSAQDHVCEFNYDLIKEHICKFEFDATRQVRVCSHCGVAGNPNG